jgi:5'-3' exonuclease
MTFLLVDGTNVVMRMASVMSPAPFEECDELARANVCRVATKAIVECAEMVSATHLIVAFDSSIDPWRKKRFPEYKAKRTTPTSAWSNVLNIYLATRGVLCVREATFEADDVLATLAARLERAGKPSYVLSSDSDLLQLSSLLIRVVQFGRSPEPRFVVRTMDWIREHYEIPTSGHLAVFKALCGEPGDGIPGVPGIGPVKARKILALASSIDDIPRLLPTMTDAMSYRLALDLITLRTDVPVGLLHPHECRLTPSRLTDHEHRH